MRPDEPLFVERMAHNRARKSVLERDVQHLERQLAMSKKAITGEMIVDFAQQLNDVYSPRRRSAFRSAYVRLFMDRVELTSDEIRIFGRKSAIEKSLTHPEDPAGAAVPIFDRKWCPWPASNCLAKIMNCNHNCQ